jgi:hypothetical protein
MLAISGLIITVGMLAATINFTYAHFLKKPKLEYTVNGFLKYALWTFFACVAAVGILLLFSLLPNIAFSDSMYAMARFLKSIFAFQVHLFHFILPMDLNPFGCVLSLLINGRWLYNKIENVAQCFSNRSTHRSRRKKWESESKKLMVSIGNRMDVSYHPLYFADIRTEQSTPSIYPSFATSSTPLLSDDASGCELTKLGNTSPYQAGGQSLFATNSSPSANQESEQGQDRLIPRPL